ncbi:LysR family transcriptional regulator [Mesorhizobium sp. B283B1A]|uniref:LysR family transcriptional regulator n=1 Tax=Mesorhizobium TaxID=68287 RepID=UPI001CD0C179|nr:MULTISPECIES: LysR substrate-binding domain-containing protein [Mesorhizobium]MCA0050243.1 LysR family transcriptional regulator [Mesorhizobium sp. B283B1A]UQS66557.1 LysR substrate-binding domain-containing protein [Mesorhizobium opportunistum]
MELSQLRTLIHVAELGSLSKAADRLHIAQPALSRQVRMLEEELGFALFLRHGRGMVLSEQGKEVLTHAMRVMAEIDEIRATATPADAPLTGEVAIGLPPTVADIVSLPLAAAFGKAHPNAKLRLVSAYTGYLLDWMHRGEVDVAVLYDPRMARSLRSRPLLLENLFLIGPPDAGFSTVRAVSFTSLAGKRLLLPSIKHGLRIIVERCATDAGITLDVGIEADSYSALKDLVRNGHGWTILPLAPIHADVVAGQLTAAPLIDPVPVRRLILAYPADRPASRLARFAGQAIEDIAKDLVGRAVWVGQLLGPSS